MYMYIICICILYVDVNYMYMYRLYVYVYYMYMCAYVFHGRHHKATEDYEDYEVMKSENQTTYIYNILIMHIELMLR